jgi:hypothetical protein
MGTTDVAAPAAPPDGVGARGLRPEPVKLPGGAANGGTLGGLVAGGAAAGKLPEDRTPEAAGLPPSKDC